MNRTDPEPADVTFGARPTSTRNANRAEGARLAMVGRERELDALKAAFQSVVERRKLQMVTALGEAGIGKSRLSREFQWWLNSLPAFQAIQLYGRAEASSSGQPFSLIRDVFRNRFEILDNDPATVAIEKFERGFADLPMTWATASRFRAPIIAQLLGFDFSAGRQSTAALEDPRQTRHQVFAILSDLFLAMMPPDRGFKSGLVELPARALLLVLEDIHWSDDDSLDFVAHLNRACQDSPMMIVALARPGLLERRPAWSEGMVHHSRLDVCPLSPRESELLVQTIMNEAPRVPSAFCDTVLADAGGNPFYIEEIIKVLIEKQVITPVQGAWRFDPKRLAATALSPKLTGVLRARLDGLSDVERTALQCASVVGHVFWDRAVARVAGATSRPGADGGSVSRQAIAESLAGLCGKELIHRRESSGFAGMAEFSFKHKLLQDVAYDGLSRQARRQCHAEVAEWFVEHGGDRIKEFAGLVAVHFEQADRLTQAAEWYGRAGELAQRGYAPAAAIEFFQKAIHLHAAAPDGSAGNAQRLGWYEGLSEAFTIQGRFAESSASFGKMRSLAEACGDVGAQARAWNGLAYLHERRGDIRASIEAAEKAESLLRQAGEKCSDDLIRALDLKGWALYRLSDAPGVLALAAQTFNLCKEAGNRVRMINSLKLYGVANLQLGRYQDANRYFREGLELCQELGDRYNAGAMFSNLGETARLRGDHASAAELYRKALEVSREMGDRPSEMIYLSNLGGALFGLGQLKNSEDALREAIASAGTRKSCTLSETYSFLAAACLGQGKLRDALVAAVQAVDIGRQTETLLHLAGSWRVLGQVLAATAQAGAFEGASIPAGFNPPLRDAASCFAEGLRLFETIGAEDEQARTLLTWAEFDKQQGRLDEAARKSSQSQRILGRLADSSGPTQSAKGSP